MQSYIKQRNLLAVDNLRQQLEQDSKIVENRIKQGVEVYKVLQYMHNESRVDHSIETENEQSPPTPPEYVIKPVHKDQFPFGSKKRHMLVAVLNRLSSKADYELYTHKPVVEQVGNEWKLTMYGDLLTHTVFEQKDSTWVYTYSTDQHNLKTRQKELIAEFVSSK
ncbi:hypothetical protein [Haloarcula amylolytica]|uniref:hypothetical protein n=1 Tax=Haloarcula amylolytica TaxID=396317 RepID=UPI001266E692|nr:hypothetical protein [Haloarcula amylolytica]